jgi:phosphoribosyl 1,2-cyclic phosphodiesterase/ActR/RegA family two-component response regulator
MPNPPNNKQLLFIAYSYYNKIRYTFYIGLFVTKNKDLRMAQKQKMHFLIIDDDKVTVDIYARLLTQAGHRVTSVSSGGLAQVLTQITNLEPDCILCDLLMPELDGLEVFQSTRKIHHIKQPTFIIITSKLFEFDRRQAFELGVDGYITKPINPQTFVSDIIEIVMGSMVVQFWGVRGTFPVPGRNTIRYGGNTNCVTLCIAKRYFFIFDAGTGIKSLSNYLLAENKLPISAKIFITHPHYDHINGIPFFVPLYMPGNEFEILGTNHGDESIENLISNQMDSVYFPITIKEFAAKLSFRNLGEESFYIDSLHIKSILLNHPGRCLGFRVEHKDRSFCYITDNELYLESSPHYNQHEVDRLIHFIQGTDFLVIDCTYTDEEYLKRVGWGHSCVSRVIDVADKADVKVMCLYHHSPDEFDLDIDLKLSQAKSLLKSRKSKTRCIAAREGEKFVI